MLAGMTALFHRVSFRRLLPSLSLGLTLGLSSVSSPAQPAPAPAESASAHFNAVAKHLEIGGGFFSYVDVDGDFKTLAEAGDKLLALARKNGADQIPPNLKATTILETLGLDGIKAIGLSSRSLPNGLYHNRALVYIPEGRTGLLRLTGGKPAPLAAPSFVPAGADLVVENDVSLSPLTEIVESILQKNGDERALMQFRAALGFPVPGLPMTIRDFVEKLDFKSVLALQLDPSKTLPLPDDAGTFPAFKAVLALDSLDFLFDPLLGFAAATDRVTVEKGDGFELIRPKKPLSGDFSYFDPVLYRDVKTKRVFAATHLAYVKECLAAEKPLSGDPAFIAAVDSLPKEGNALSYATPRLLKAILDATEAIGKKSSSDKPEIVDEVLRILQEMSPLPSASIASVWLNAPEGFIVQSNTADSHKTTLAQAAIIPGAFVAGAVSGYREARSINKELEESDDSDDEGEDMEKETEPDRGATRTIRNNLQQIVFAAQSWFIDNPSAKEVTYEKLVEAELLFELDPVAGEAYKGLTITRKGGSLSVKTKDGDSVSLNYAPVTD